MRNRLLYFNKLIIQHKQLYLEFICSPEMEDQVVIPSKCIFFYQLSTSRTLSTNLSHTKYATDTHRSSNETHLYCLCGGTTQTELVCQLFIRSRMSVPCSCPSPPHPPLDYQVVCKSLSKSAAHLLYRKTYPLGPRMSTVSFKKSASTSMSVLPGATK